MKKFLYFLCSVLLISYSASAQVIITKAGKGVEGYTGDGTMADTCQLHWPESIAITDSGDFLIADANNNVIRRIYGKTGIIKTVIGSGYHAGTGTGGYGGDGGPATAARLNYPSGVVVDHIGNIFIADQRNDRIRKVDTFGVITTVAGNGFAGFSGDMGTAISARLYHPTRIALDATGNIFIADSGNNRIRKVDVTGNINTVAGSGAKGYFGDGGSALTARLNNPIDMAVDGVGNIYICDYGNNRIRKVDAASGNISTFAGIGIPGFSNDGLPATVANIYEPSAIIIDAGSGTIYFSDLANFRIRKIDASGIITTVAGNGIGGYNGDGITATTAQLQFPEGLALDSRGQLYVCDKGNNRIRLISKVLAVNELNESGAAISLFPNPNNGEFNINITSAIDEDVHIFITTITGARVNDFNARTNSPTPVTIGNGQMPPGMYLLTVITPHGMLNERVVIR